MKIIRNQFALATCVAALFLQFAVFEPYIYQDAFKEFTQFNANFIWMYGIFFAIGGGIYLLASKQKSWNASIGLAVWGSLMTLAGTLSLSLLQNLLRHTKVNSLTIMMPLIYCVLLCFAATVQFATLDTLVKKIVSDSQSLIAPICLAVGGVSAVLIFVPYQLSYQAVILIMGIALMCCAFFAGDFQDKTIPVRSQDDENKQQKKADARMASFTWVQLAIFAFGVAILFANVKAFADAYRYRSQDMYILYIAVAGAVYAGRKLYQRYASRTVLRITSAVAYFVSLLILTFVHDYVWAMILCAVAGMGGIIQLSFITERMRQNGCLYRKSFAFASVLSVIVPFLLGYWTGVYMTMGGGQMTDIWAGIYLEPIRTNSLIARGVMPDANGVYAEYTGIGERIALSYKRFAYLPSPFLPLISAAICEVAFFFHMVVEYKSKRCIATNSENEG